MDREKRHKKEKLDAKRWKNHNEMVCNVVSCYVMSCHVTLYYVMLRYVTLRYVTSCNVTLRYVVSCYGISLASARLPYTPQYIFLFPMTSFTHTIRRALNPTTPKGVLISTP
jgi:hypothetical protein